MTGQSLERRRPRGPMNVSHLTSSQVCQDSGFVESGKSLRAEEVSELLAARSFKHLGKEIRDTKVFCPISEVLDVQIIVHAADVDGVA